MSRAGHDESDVGRSEEEQERLNRQMIELLNELRVAMPGVQVLFGFLLTVPFQQRFTELTEQQRVVYLITIGLSATATALLIAPVSMHRLLFRRRARASLVAAAQRFSLAGLAMLGLAVTGVVLLIFELVLGQTGGIVAGAATFVVFTVLWVVVPVVRRGRGDDQQQ
jgi:hypothetical protein